MDVKPGNGIFGRDYPAWIRRDFISNESYWIPLLKASKVTEGTIVVRVPSLKHPKEMEDWVSSIKCGEAAAEGGIWTKTCTGARLPTQDLQKPLRSILTEDRSIERNKMHCALCINEERTGEVLLTPKRGDLMQEEWDIRQIIPPGWKRDRGITGLLVRE
ncbi:hypothetical protein GGR51DRAFT_574021 [Nemania sp. FL0031]|nr:hypothetical protein GGR51DRAFT_574021 [Nemania sp. FL0031]